MVAEDKVLAVTDKGIIIDAFNQKSREIPCKACVLHKELVVYAVESEVIVYNTEKEKKCSFSIAGGSKIEVSPDGAHVAVLTKKQELYLAQISEEKILFREESVFSFSVSNMYLVYSHAVEVPIAVETPNLSLSFASSASLPPNSAKERERNSSAVKSTAKTVEKAGNMQEDTKYHAAPKPAPSIQKKKGVEQKEVRKAVPRGLFYVKIGENTKQALQIRAPFSFSVSGTYLYLCRIFGMQGGEIEIISLESKKSIKKISGSNLAAAEFYVDQKHQTERALCVCTLNSTSTTYYDVKILYYLSPSNGMYRVISTEGPICDYVFLQKGEFAVCHGNSPSSVSIYNLAGEKIKELKKAVRNKLFFNRQENLVCFAGMNNLPGTIEIAEAQTEAFVSSTEMLGCSVVDWSPSGQMYLVGVTSRMAVGNCITLFDYYSRKVTERFFSCLIYCGFIGKDVPFRSIADPPEKVCIMQKTIYIPPSMRTESTVQQPFVWRDAYIVKSKAEEKEKRVLKLLAELEEIEKIEKKMSQGQIVPGGILKIQKKDALLKKVAKHRNRIS